MLHTQAIAIQFDPTPKVVPVTVWTEERTTLLISRWEAGCSALEISKELGITRNAVIGKADRMKLQRKIDNIFWSDEDVETLKRMWALRYTAKDIAAQIHRRGNNGPTITRGSVLTKANRLGLKPREGSQRASQKPRTSMAVGPYVEGPMPKYFRSVSFADLADDQCRFPRGDTTILFCGQPRMASSVYCVDCHHRCYYRR